MSFVVHGLRVGSVIVACALAGCSLAVDTEHLRSGGPLVDSGGSDGTSDGASDGASDGTSDGASDTDVLPDGLSDADVSETGETASDVGPDAMTDGAETGSPTIGAVFSLGGTIDVPSGNPHTPDVLRLEIHADGTTGHWTTETAMPAAGSGCGAASSGKHLYVVGGDLSALTTQNVRFAPISSGFRLGDWSTASKLPDDRVKLGVVATATHLYAIGGATGATPTVHPEVMVATISATDGSLGAWTNTTALPAGRFALGAVTASGYVYAIGGQSSSAGPRETTVYLSKIQVDGTLGAWTTTAPLPAGLYGTSAVVIGGRIYVVGGYGGTHAVHYALPDATSGAIGSWTTASVTMKSPHAFFGLAGIESPGNSFLISIAGFDDGSAGTDAVEMSSIASSGSLGAFQTLEKLGGNRRFLSAFGLP